MRVATSEHNPKTKALGALKRRVHEGSYSFRRSKSRPETSQNGPGIHENVQARPPKMAPARCDNVPQNAAKRKSTKPHYLLGFDGTRANNTYHSGEMTFFALKSPLWQP